MIGRDAYFVGVQGAVRACFLLGCSHVADTARRAGLQAAAGPVCCAHTLKNVI